MANRLQDTAAIAAALLVIPAASFATTQTNTQHAASAHALPHESSSALTRDVLPDGMRVVVRKETETPLIAVDILVKIGSDRETLETAGIDNFVASTLLSSTGSRPPETIRSEIADLGGNITVNREPDWTEISALTVPDKFDDLVNLLTDVLKDATFDPDTVEAKRADILNQIDSGEADIFNRTYSNLKGELFSGTGYAFNTLGTSRSITRMTQDKLLRYYRQYFIPKNMVFTVVGNVDPNHALSTLGADMLDYDPLLRGSKRHVSEDTPLPQLAEDMPPVAAYDTDLTEVGVMAGFRTPSMGSDDYPALQVLNALLGGMKSSRLFVNLREKQGLAYELGSFYSPQLYAGNLTGFVFGAPTRLDDTTKKPVSATPVIREQLLKQIAAMQSTPPTKLELERAKRYLIGTYKIKHERVEQRASLLAIAELTSPHGAEIDEDYADYIDAVTADDVQRVARTYLVHPVISTIEPDPHNGNAVSE